MARYGRGGGGGYGDDFGGGQRWDSDRPGRERDRFGGGGGGGRGGHGGQLAERDRYEEHDYYQPRESFPPRRESSADAYYNRRGGRGGGGGGGRDFDFIERDRGGNERDFTFKERDRPGGERDFVFKEREERFGPPARRPRPPPQKYYEDDDLDTFDDGANRGGQLISIKEHRGGPGYGSPRGPPRPGLLRRQSSLDTFDRKPLPRYGGPRRLEPETIVMPSRPAARQRSPPRYIDREYYEEDDFFEGGEFRGAFRERERSVTRKRAPSRPEPISEYESSYQVEEEEFEKPYPRKGKTKMPGRLVSKRAIIELGYPFDEEGETIIIKKALGKEHIDQIIEISKRYGDTGGEKTRTTYMIEAPAPPGAEPSPEVVERKTEIIISPPPVEQPHEVPRSVREWDALSGAGLGSVKSSHTSHTKKSHKSHKSSGTKKSHSTKKHKAHRSHRSHHSRHRSRSSSSSSSRSNSSSNSSSSSGTARGRGYVEIVHREPSRSRSKSHHRRKSIVIEERERKDPELSLVVPHHRDRKKEERDIQAEIRALEAEKRELKYEREHHGDRHYRDGEVIIERDRGVSRYRDADEVIIEKAERKKKGDNKIMKAMAATLT